MDGFQASLIDGMYNALFPNFRSLGFGLVQHGFGRTRNIILSRLSTQEQEYHPQMAPLACQVGSCLVWPCCFPRLVLFGLVPSPPPVYKYAIFVPIVLLQVTTGPTLGFHAPDPLRFCLFV